jgi:ribosomal protein S16
MQIKYSIIIKLKRIGKLERILYRIGNCDLREQ